MFAFNHYVPMLKSKAGEFEALSKLSDTSRSYLTPFLDITDLDVRNKDSLELQLKKLAGKISSAWGEKAPLFIDFFDMPLDSRCTDGSHPITFICDHLNQSGVKSIPVTGLDRDEGYNEAIKDILGQAPKNGVCVRLLREDIELPASLNVALPLLLSALNISKGEAHLLFDFRSIKDSPIDVFSDMAIKAINTLDGIAEWRTLTVAASGMPQSLSEAVPTKTVGMISRKEMALWKIILSQKNQIKRVPSFGDYGIVHPDKLELDMRIVSSRMGPGIRYATANEWLIVRGASFRSAGYGQYYDLAKIVATHPHFMGADFSYGDGCIATKADGISGTGNTTTWVSIGTNHHLAFAAEQVATTTL